MNLTPVVNDSIRKFIRLTPLIDDKQHGQRFRDETDLIEAIDCVRDAFHDTKDMIGKKMYQGVVFEPVEDVKRALEEYLLGRRERKDVALARRKNLIMYHLAVEPVIEMFKGIPHPTALMIVDEVLDEVQNLINTMDIDSHIDDALVAQAQVSVLIKEREEKRKRELAARRRKKRRRKTLNLTAAA